MRGDHRLHKSKENRIAREMILDAEGMSGFQVVLAPCEDSGGRGEANGTGKCLIFGGYLQGNRRPGRVCLHDEGRELVTRKKTERENAKELISVRP